MVAEFYDVEEILGHRETCSRLELKLRWVGFCEEHDSWEPVGNFDANSMVQSYLQANNLNSSSTQLGCNAGAIVLSEEVNLGEFLDDCGTVITENFVSIYRTAGVVHQLRGHRAYTSSLRVLHTWEKLPKEDSILLYGDDYHLYVIYYRPGKTSWITDGANASFDGAFLRKCRRKFGACEALRYNGQRGDDHCSSSGVIAALFFLQLSKLSPEQRDNPGEISAPTQLRERLVAKLNPGETRPLPGKPNIGDRAQGGRRCAFCGKSFFKAGMQALRCHERGCKQKG